MTCYGKSNLYQPSTTGFFIYHVRKNGDQRWSATRKWSNGQTKSALCYSVDEAHAFLDALSNEAPAITQNLKMTLVLS